MIKKIFVYIGFSLLSVLATHAQSTDVDLMLMQKYWNYRDNFRKNFIKVGWRQGESLPAVSIDNYWKESDGSWSPMVLYSDSLKLKANRTTFNAGKKGPEYWSRKLFADVLAWEDCHLGVLATEYWLLTNSAAKDEESINAVKNELYFAIMAVDRLDEKADNYYDELYTGITKNGFLIRDDVSVNITKPAYPRYNYGGEYMASNYDYGIWYNDTIRNSKGQLEYYGPDSFKLERKQDWAPNAENEMSQDQIVGLFAGFSFVQKYVNWDLIVDPDGSGPLEAKNLVTWTAEITDRIMTLITKMSYNIKMYDGETYDNLKKKKNLKRIEDNWYVNVNDISNQINNSDYKKLSSQEKSNYRTLTADDWDGTEQSNPTIADSANYVLYNPAINNRHVYRGPYAFALGYPLEVLGERLASANQDSAKDYPSVQVMPSSWTYNKMTLLNAPVSGLYAFSAFGLGAVAELWNMTAGVFVNGVEFLQLYDDARASCPGAFIAPVENLNIFSKCVFNHSFQLYDPEFWKDVWKSISTDQFCLSVLSKVDNTSLATNIFQWIAASSGTWEHNDYNYLFGICGQPYNDIIYAVLNDKKPIKTKKYYEDVLLTAPIEGQNNGIDADMGSPFMRNQIWKRFSDPVTEFGFSKFNGLQYMLLYNAYKISRIKYWSSSNPGANFEYCPKTASGSKKYIAYCVNPKSIGFDYSIDTIVYKNPEWTYAFKFNNALPRGLFDSISTGIAFPDYMKYGIRIPDVISANYNVGFRIASNKRVPSVLNVTYDLNVSGCVLTINKGIVKTTSPTRGEIYRRIRMMNQSKLEIYTDSRIDIANDTRLEIDAGSTLKYHPGARIILNGPNAVLHIKGKLELAPGATFQIEGGPAGKGYVIWDCGEGSPHYGRATLQAGAGSKMVFKQNDNNKLALEVRGFSGMYLPNTLQSFFADTCRINLKEQAFIACNAQFARFSKLDVYGHNDGHKNPEFDYKPSSRGIQVWAQKNEFNNVRIIDCQEAISIVNLWGVNQPLKLKNVTLINNQTGIRNHGGRIIWEDGLIDDNNNGTSVTQLRTGITGIGTQGPSFLHHVTISVNDYTWMGANNPKVRYSAPAAANIANIWDHGTGRYYLTKCKLEHAKYGSIMNQSYLFPQCSEYLNNTTGVYMMQGSRMVAEGGAWNSFTWTTADTDKVFFRGINGVNIYLDSGRNYIKGINDQNGHYFFSADILRTQPLAPSDRSTGTNAEAIMARGNQWVIGGSSGKLRTTNAKITVNDACASLVKYSNVSVPVDHLDINYLPQYSGVNWKTDQQTACASRRRIAPEYPGNDWPINQGVIIKLTATGNNDLVKLVRQRSADLETEFNRPVINYPQLIGTASNFFNTPFPVEVGAAVFEVYSRVHTFYPLAFTDTNISAASRQATLNSIQQELNIMQDRLIDRANGTDPTMWTEYRFALHRDKALIQRAFNQRHKSIMQLNMAIPTFSKPNDIQSLEAWRCLIQKEQACLDSLIPYWMLNLDTCLMNFDSLSRWDSTFSEQWSPERNRTLRRGASVASNNWEDTKTIQQQAPPNKPLHESDFILRIRPNPTEGLLHLSMRGQPAWVEIIDAKGQLLQKISRGASEMELQMGHLPDGIYVIRVVHAQGVNTETIIKRSE